MKKLVTMLGLLVALFPAVVNAAPQAGAYIGASIGSTDIEDEMKDHFGSLITNTDFNETASSLYLGYRFTPYLALEAAYRDLGEAKFTTLSSDVYDYDFSAITVSALGFLPLADNFEFFAKLGMHRTEIDASGTERFKEHDTGLLYGAGVSYSMDSVSFRAGYEKLAIKKDGLDVKPSIYSFAVQYNF